MKEPNITQLVYCPKCGKPYTGHPAVSRVDNQTLICPDCGILESLESIGVNEVERQEILQIIHRSQQKNR